MHPEFRPFLIAAKAATYAAQGDDASVAPLLPDSKQLEYCRDPFLYRDIYVGMLRFAGQEIVYESGRALWSMSYAGGLVSGSAKDVYAFLRQALSRAGEAAELPVRGPGIVAAAGMHYRCAWRGTLERFTGTESITRGDQLLFELQFAGGSID